MKYILVFWNKCSKRSVQKLQTIFIANYLGYFSKRLNFSSRRMKKKYWEANIKWINQPHNEHVKIWAKRKVTYGSQIAEVPCFTYFTWIIPQILCVYQDIAWVRLCLHTCSGTPQQDGCIAARDSGILMKWRKPQFTFSPRGSASSPVSIAQIPPDTQPEDWPVNLQWTERNRFVWVSNSVIFCFNRRVSCRCEPHRGGFFRSLLPSFLLFPECCCN